MPSELQISVVLPGFNESGNIDALIAQVTASLDATDLSYEIIYVDDGSTDDSRSRLEAAARKFGKLRVAFHARNFGQSAAILTGIEASRGALVATMDSDLQNDPADLPMMIRFLEDNNYDFVCGIRQKRMDTFVRRLSSKVANTVRNWILSDGIQDSGCALRLMRKTALSNLPPFRAVHRFLPAILLIQGCKVGQIPVSHRLRHSGTSKYGIGNRLWVGITDLFGVRWLRKRAIDPRRNSELKFLELKPEPASDLG